MLHSATTVHSNRMVGHNIDNHRCSTNRNTFNYHKQIARYFTKYVKTSILDID